MPELSLGHLTFDLEFSSERDIGGESMTCEAQPRC